MASETELERLVVRLLGDGTSYQKMLLAAEAQTKRAQTRFAKLSVSMQAIGMGMTRVGIGLLKVTGPLAVIGALSVRAFAKFDKAMIESTSIMSATVEQMERMRQTALDLSSISAQGPEEMAKSFFFLASAGLDAEQAIAALPIVTKFATAGAFDMALATDLLTDAQSALGLTVKDTAQNMVNMTRVSDVLVKANTLANATVSQFSTALTAKAGSALKAFNKDVEEGVAVLAAMADQGIKAELAGNSLARIMLLLSKASQKNREDFERLNFRVFDGEGKMRNFADIIENLETSLAGMSDQQKAAALTALGFEARVQGAILPLLGTSDAIRRYEKELRKAGGTTADVADKQMKSLANRAKVVWNQITVLAIEIGGALVPAVESMLAVIKPVVTSITEWVKEHPGLTAAILATATALAAMSVVAIGMGAIISSLGALIGGLATAYTFLTGAVVANTIALLANPIGLLIAVVVGLIAVVLALATGFGQATEAVKVFSQEQKALLAEADRVQDSQRGLFRELEALSKMRTRSVKEIEREKAIVAELESTYGDLGIEIDSLTGKVSGLEDAQKKLNAAMGLANVEKLKDRFAELSTNIDIVKGRIVDSLIASGAVDRDRKDLPVGDSKQIKREVGDLPITAVRDFNELKRLEREQSALRRRIEKAQGTHPGVLAAPITAGERARAEEAAKKATEPGLGTLLGGGLKEAQDRQQREINEVATKQLAEMQEVGKRLIEQFATPQEMLDKTIDDLNQLMAVGALGEGAQGEFVFNRALEEAQKKFEDATKGAKDLKDAVDDLFQPVIGTIAGTAQAEANLRAFRQIGGVGAGGANGVGNNLEPEDERKRLADIAMFLERLVELEEEKEGNVLEVEEADL